MKDTATKLRPESRTYWHGIGACVAFMAPVFVVLYVLTIPEGPWAVVLVTQIIASLLVTAASVGFFGVGISVSPEGISERGFFGRLSYFPREQIGSIVRARTFEGSSVRTAPQLFVCDGEGRQLVRMRGQFWSVEKMDLVTSTLEVPISHIESVRSIKELGSDYPGLLYWFERHPVTLAALFTVVVGALAVLAFAALTMAGVQFGAR